MASAWTKRLIAGTSLLVALVLLACSGDAEPALEPATPTRESASTPDTTATPEAPGRTPTATVAPTATSTPDLGLILPDLETTDSDDVYISVNFNGVRLLHFSTEVHNTGPGPLQVIGPEPEAGADATEAWQVIETRAAGRLERFAGVLQVNEEHGTGTLMTSPSTSCGRTRTGAASASSSRRPRRSRSA